MSSLITGPRMYDGEEGSAAITVWGDWWGHTYPKGPTVTGKREWLIWEARVYMLNILMLQVELVDLCSKRQSHPAPSDKLKPFWDSWSSNMQKKTPEGAVSI